MNHEPEPAAPSTPLIPHSSWEEINNTDNDMLTLRAIIDVRIAIERKTLELKDALEEIQRDLDAFMNLDAVDEEGTTPEEYLRKHRKLTMFNRTRAALKGLTKDIERNSRSIENGHHNIIRAARTRAETRALEEKCNDTTVFGNLLQRLMIILQEQLPPPIHAALRKRIDHDLDELIRFQESQNMPGR